jgi:hypothetical protein
MYPICCVPIKRVTPSREVSGVRLGGSVSAKVKGANGNHEGSVGTPRADPVPKSNEELAVELADVAAALSEDEDAFNDTPTVSNRPNPTTQPSEPPSEPEKVSDQGLTGAGAYRMVRPATSDRIDVPAPAAPGRPAADRAMNRVIIGVARKS